MNRKNFFKKALSFVIAFTMIICGAIIAIKLPAGITSAYGTETETDASETDASATDASATDASATDASATDASATDAVKGDIDGDGKVEVDDARLALRQAIGLETVTEAADVDGSGEVTVDDARLVLRVAIGLESFD